MVLELDKDDFRYFCVFRCIESGILVKVFILYYERLVLGF